MSNRKPHSEETKRKISEGNKGKKRTEEQKKRIGETLGSYWRGRKRGPFTEEHRRKLKEARNRRGLASEETRRKMSEARKGKPWSEEHRKKALEHTITSIEIKVSNQFEKYGIRYIPQKQLCKGHFIVDFYLPEYQLVVECNGDYWHSRPERKKRDKELEEYVLSKGKDILWLWEHEINDEWFDIADYLEVE